MKNDEYSSSQPVQEAATFLQSKHQPTTEELYKILHELRIYQIELEAQNKELRETHEQLEKSRNMYVELYDSAPIGYVTLTNSGYIHKSNLTAAQMLRYDRSRLIGQPFVVFVEKNDTDLFIHHLRQCYQETKASTELCLTRLGRRIHIQLISILVQEQRMAFPYYHTVILDIDEHSQPQLSSRRVPTIEKEFAESRGWVEKEYTLLENKIVRLKADQLERQLEARTSELSQMALSFIEKYEWFSGLEKKLKQALRASPSKSKKLLQQTLQELKNKLVERDQWHVFEQQLGETHRQFLHFMAVAYPSLTPTELKICCLLRLNLSTKEVARLLHTSSKTIENQRYRIRKKMNISSGKNLTAFLLACE